MTPKTLEEAVGTFLRSLSDEDKATITSSLPLYNLTPARRYIDALIDMFQLYNPNSEIAKDIDRKYPDDFCLFHSDLGKRFDLFYGQTILQEACKLLDNSAD